MPVRGDPHARNAGAANAGAANADAGSVNRAHGVGRTTYLSRIPTVRRRSARGDPEGPWDSIRPTGPPAWSEGCPRFDRPTRGTETAAPPGTRSGTGCFPGGAADHRSASGLAFLGAGGGDQPGNDVLPHTEGDVQPMGESQHPGVARLLWCSPMKGKTPLVLPYGGERRKGDCFAQPPGKSSLPHRERQRRSCSQGAVGHPLERDREGLATRRMCLCSKNGSAKGSRPAMISLQRFLRPGSYRAPSGCTKWAHVMAREMSMHGELRVAQVASGPSADLFSGLFAESWGSVGRLRR